MLSTQGKPPDFVLEIASPSSRRRDRITKRQVYADLGISEYWRFDETDDPRRVKLAGDRLSPEGQYRPIAIERLADGTLQGYSAVLNLYLRWEGGRLRWHDPATGRHIVTLEDERARADREQAARLQAEARARELEAELRRLRGR